MTPSEALDVKVRIDQYCDMVQEKENLYFERCGFTFSDPPKIMATYGKKYARIVKVDQLNGSRSVHTFVNMLNGDIPVSYTHLRAHET